MAAQLGQILARNGIELVYGGGHVGLMGAVADAALGAGGRVIGVMPQSLIDREVGHKGLTEMHIVRTMHERKALMAKLADGFIALPGGYGTLDEFCEILTWAQLGIHAKPYGVLNTDGYYDALLALFDHGVEEGFVKSPHRENAGGGSRHRGIGGVSASMPVGPEASTRRFLQAVFRDRFSGRGASNDFLRAKPVLVGPPLAPVLKFPEQFRNFPDAFRFSMRQDALWTGPEFALRTGQKRSRQSITAVVVVQARPLKFEQSHFNGCRLRTRICPQRLDVLDLFGKFLESQPVLPPEAQIIGSLFSCTAHALLTKSTGAKFAPIAAWPIFRVQWLGMEGE